MHTEEHCKTLNELDPVKAIRAIHQAFLQLTALTIGVDCKHFDNNPAMSALADCMAQAGHIGFVKMEVEQ